MPVLLDPKLNLVVPLERADGTMLWAHAQPISKLVFDAHYLALAQAFTAIYQAGISMHAGPRVAANILRQTIASSGRDEATNRGLLAEIRRLTNIVLPGEGGYSVLPFEDAARKRLLDEDEIAEVEGLITFFILNSAIHRKTILPGFLRAANDLWGTSTTSSNVTEFVASLPTSTAAASTGGTAPTPPAPPSSIPY
jgi:hypothetical protein